MKLLLFLYFIFISLTPAFAADDDNDLFVVVTSSDAETQMMSMVLATQSANQDVNVRVLLCSDGGNLAIETEEFPVFQPAGRTPQQLLMGLLDRGVTVEVCAIYLPNREYTEDDLMDGVGMANPQEVARYMKQEQVRYFTF